MAQLTLNIPTVTVDERAVYVTLVLLGAALLTTIAYEIIKRRYTAKQLKQFGMEAQKRGKTAVAIIFTALATFFTLLGSLLFIMEDHQDFLASLPFVGKHVMTVVGVAWFVYNLRLSRTYQTVAVLLGKWSTKKQPVTEVVLDGVPPEVLA